MKAVRPLVLLVAILILGTTSLVQAQKGATHDFDFWSGDWYVTVSAALPDGNWRTAEGQSSTRLLAGDHAHMDTLATDLYKSSGVRAYNVGTAQWDYTMFDNQLMKGLQVWSGGFEDGVGTFAAKIALAPGVSADTRVIIDEIKAKTFNWRFEMSTDGETWRTVMKLDFRRDK